MLRNEIVIRKEFIIPANLNALLAIIVKLSKGNVKKWQFWVAGTSNGERVLISPDHNNSIQKPSKRKIMFYPI